MTKPVSLETRQRQSRAQLSRKQLEFAVQYAHLGNGVQAARRAGYKGSGNVLGVQAHHNLRHPKIASAIKQELAKIELEISPMRVQCRLDEISRESQQAGQYGPSVRAEELIGRSLGMFIDRSLQLTGQLRDEHVTALLELAKRRRAEPIDLTDDQQEHSRGHDSDSE